MVVPSRDQCLELLRQHDMPLHIRSHSLMVTEVALFISTRLNRNSCRLDLRLVEASALLHDIGKKPGLETGENHAQLGARMLEGIVSAPVARIVADHIYMDASQTAGPLTESLIVNYADKRVKHDRVVSIRERFEDLIERYAKSPTQAGMLRGKLDLYIALESTIFSHLSIAPHDPEIMGITILISEKVT
ncbi:MAG: HD domain-containing protein [Syntrophobacteraceae bacterium]|nr:HD domain-containing protein [Syntrophobacteraceae bacterium]